MILVAYKEPESSHTRKLQKHSFSLLTMCSSKKNFRIAADGCRTAVLTCMGNGNVLASANIVSEYCEFSRNTKKVFYFTIWFQFLTYKICHLTFFGFPKVFGTGSSEFHSKKGEDSEANHDTSRCFHLIGLFVVFSTLNSLQDYHSVPRFKNFQNGEWFSFGQDCMTTVIEGNIVCDATGTWTFEPNVTPGQFVGF